MVAEPTPRTLASASVIVASRDRPTLLRELLASLAKTTPLPGEVVIADDGSVTPIASYLPSRTWPFRLHILRNESSHGPANARNRAVHASRGDLLLFTDDDCVVDLRWVDALASPLVNEDRQLAGVGGRVLARDADLYSRYFEFHRVLEPRPHDASHPERIPYLVTANCAVRRDAFMRAGGFDETIRFAGGEDAALSMRLAKSGFHFHRQPAAVVRHRFRPGIRALARMFYQYGKGGRYVVDRYLPL
jgi:GT2 family glycosyltransferase